MLALAAAFCLLIPLAPPADAAPAEPSPPPSSTAPVTTGPAGTVTLTTGPAGTVTLSTENVLTVTFDDNETGGTAWNNNPMKDAIDAALAAQGTLWGDVDRLVLTGDAAEITRYNWEYLRNMCFATRVNGKPYGSPGDRLRTVDLSGMANLEKISAINMIDTDWGDRVFPETEPRKVLLPPSLTEIGEYAFTYCSALQLDEPPPSLEVIGGYSFARTPISWDAIPDTVREIGWNAFINCKKFVPTEIPASLTSIGYGAFAGTNITELTFQDGVTKIDPSAFYQCTKLKKVVFPKTLESIAYGAFKGCTSLKELALPRSLEKIAGDAFQNCRLEAVYFEGEAPELWDDGYGHNTLVEIFGRKPFWPPTAPPVLQSTTLFFAPEAERASFAGSEWDDARPDQLYYYPDPGSLGGSVRLKYGFTNDAYESMSFELLAPETQSAGTVGSLQVGKPADWEVYDLDGVNLLASGGWSPREPYVGVVTLNPRWWGNILLRMSFNLNIYYDNGNPATAGWREFPFGAVSLDAFPPAPPAQAAYELKVINGEGSGWYRADGKAPLKALPPYPGAQFLRWELKSGTGAFDDPAQPETRFTMAVGNSAVEAVFAPFPNPAEHPTPMPQTGDTGLPLAAALIFLTGGGLLLALRRGTRRLR